MNFSTYMENVQVKKIFKNFSKCPITFKTFFLIALWNKLIQTSRQNTGKMETKKIN